MANKGLGLIIAGLFVAGGIIFMLGKNPGPATTPATPAPVAEVMAEAPAAASEPTPETAYPETSPEVTSVTATEAPTTDMTETVADLPATTDGASPAEETAATGTEAEGSLLAAPASLDLDIEKLMEDRFIGDPNAPVTIIEYASMTCPHCAKFHNEHMANVKAKLVETGKVLFIFREYPLDNVAVKASLMARCAAPEKYFDLIEIIFRNQDRWTKADDPLKAVAQLGVLAGMDETLINTCMNSAEFENAMMMKVQDGQSRYTIQQTPTFVFNNGLEKLTGPQPVEEFEVVIKKLGVQ